jgi:hypothetical protein
MILGEVDKQVCVCVFTQPTRAIEITLQVYGVKSQMYCTTLAIILAVNKVNRNLTADRANAPLNFHSTITLLYRHGIPYVRQRSVSPAAS